MFCHVSALAMVVILFGVMALCLGQKDLTLSEPESSFSTSGNVAVDSVSGNSATVGIRHFLHPKYSLGARVNAQFRIKEPNVNALSLQPKSQPTLQEPTVQCGDQIMRVVVKLQDVDNLRVVAANSVPMSLSKLPAFCRMHVKTTISEAFIISRYDGCFIKLQGSEYVLFLHWYGKPVQVSCPVPEMPPPIINCTDHGMEVTFSGHGLENTLSLRVGDAWLPLLRAAVQCGYDVGVMARKLSFIASYTSCGVTSENGLYVLLVQSREKYMTLTCAADGFHHFSSSPVSANPSKLNPTAEEAPPNKHFSRLTDTDLPHTTHTRFETFNANNPHKFPQVQHTSDPHQHIITPTEVPQMFTLIPPPNPQGPQIPLLSQTWNQFPKEPLVPSKELQAQTLSPTALNKPSTDGLQPPQKNPPFNSILSKWLSRHYSMPATPTNSRHTFITTPLPESLSIPKPLDLSASPGVNHHPHATKYESAITVPSPSVTQMEPQEPQGSSDLQLPSRQNQNPFLQVAMVVPSPTPEENIWLSNSHSRPHNNQESHQNQHLASTIAHNYINMLHQLNRKPLLHPAPANQASAFGHGDYVGLPKPESTSPSTFNSDIFHYPNLQPFRETHLKPEVSQPVATNKPAVVWWNNLYNVRPTMNPSTPTPNPQDSYVQMPKPDSPSSFNPDVLHFSNWQPFGGLPNHKPEVQSVPTNLPAVVSPTQQDIPENLRPPVVGPLPSLGTPPQLVTPTTSKSEVHAWWSSLLHDVRPPTRPPIPPPKPLDGYVGIPNPDTTGPLSSNQDVPHQPNWQSFGESPHLGEPEAPRPVPSSQPPDFDHGHYGGMPSVYGYDSHEGIPKLESFNPDIWHFANWQSFGETPHLKPEVPPSVTTSNPADVWWTNRYPVRPTMKPSTPTLNLQDDNVELSKPENIAPTKSTLERQHLSNGQPVGGFPHLSSVAPQPPSSNQPQFDDGHYVGMPKPESPSSSNLDILNFPNWQPFGEMSNPNLDVPQSVLGLGDMEKKVITIFFLRLNDLDF